MIAVASVCPTVVLILSFEPKSISRASHVRVLPSPSEGAKKDGLLSSKVREPMEVTHSPTRFTVAHYVPSPHSIILAIAQSLSPPPGRIDSSTRFTPTPAQPDAVSNAAAVNADRYPILLILESPNIWNDGPPREYCRCQTPSGNAPGWYYSVKLLPWRSAACWADGPAGEQPTVPIANFADTYETQRVLEATALAAKHRAAVRLTEVK